MSSETENKLLVRCIIVSQFAPPFMFSGVAVALPSMGSELHAGATSIGLVETIFLASQLSLLLPAGRLAEVCDKKSLYKIALFTFGFFSLLIGLLSSMPVILLLRLLQGVTSALNMATGPAILAELVPVEKRGKAYGSSIGAIYAGLTLGPICAGYLIDAAGWRAVFLVGGALLISGSFFIHWMMPSKWRRLSLTVLNIPSILLVVLCIMSFVAGTSMLHHGTPGYVFLVIGLSAGVQFIKLQGRLEHPLLNVRALLKNNKLSTALLVQLLLYINAFCSVFMLSIFMQVSLGHSPKTSGQVIAMGSVLMALAAPLSGMLADRYPPARLSSAGVMMILFSASMGIFLDEDASLIYVTVILAIQGLGFALFSSPNMTTIMNSVIEEQTTIASALGAKSRSLGMVSGMLITTVLLSTFLGNNPIFEHKEIFNNVITVAFSIQSAITLLALCISLKIIRNGNIP